MKPSLSVIIPVLGEETSINGAIDRIRALVHGGSVEIIVVDGSEDLGTLKMIRDQGVIQISSPRGRGRQMNEGAGAARGDILLFLHADTSLPGGSFDEIAAAMGSGKYGAGAFALSFDNGMPAFRLIALGARLRTWITGIPYGDQGIFMTRDYFRALGMYRHIPLLEDVDLMKRVKRDGKKIYLSPLAIITSARRWEKHGVVKRTILNLLIRLLYMTGVKPEKLAWLYSAKSRMED